MYCCYLYFWLLSNTKNINKKGLRREEGNPVEAVIKQQQNLPSDKATKTTKTKMAKRDIKGHA
jgi:hypothetical protein